MGTCKSALCRVPRHHEAPPTPTSAAVRWEGFGRRTSGASRRANNLAQSLSLCVCVRACARAGVSVCACLFFTWVLCCCFDDSRGWSNDCELKDLRCPTPSLSMGLGSSITASIGSILRAAVSFSITESMIRSLSASEPNALAIAGARNWTCAEARVLDVAGAACCLQCPLPCARVYSYSAIQHGLMLSV